MLKKVQIKKLFGRFDYTLEFPQEGVIILTGPNGYGKSTILRMIDGFCNEGLHSIISFSFKKISFICDQSSVVIIKNKSSFKINDIAFNYPDVGLARLRGTPPYFKKVGYNEYIDIRTDERFVRTSSRHLMPKEHLDIDSYLYAIEDSIDVPHTSKKSSELSKAIRRANQEIDLVRKDIGKVSFIQEQRLIEKNEYMESSRTYNQQREEYTSVINNNSEKLKRQLSEIMRRHSSLSSELDSTYIKRLFDSKDNVSTDSSVIWAELQSLQEKQEKLQRYGLAEIKNASYISALDENKMQRFSAELSIYLDDANAKYAVFEPIIKRLSLYERIVNQKLSFKKMRLSSTNGISVISDEGDNLSLQNLSSGEQEILVLFYKLIFESDVDLLLIDEPEISLHIAWQKEILDNLKGILELNNRIQVIIATHSPQIISGNWTLQIDLGSFSNG